MDCIESKAPRANPLSHKFSSYLDDTPAVKKMDSTRTRMLLFRTKLNLGLWSLV